MNLRWLDKNKLKLDDVEIDLRGRKAVQELLHNFSQTPDLTITRKEILFGSAVESEQREYSERYVRAKVHSTVKLISRTRKFLASHFQNHPHYKGARWMPYDEKEKKWVFCQLDDTN